MDGKLETAFSLNGKRVWVAGDTGMVGRATVRRLQTEECEILTVPHAQLDLCRQSDVEAWMAANKPDVVIIAAATVGGIQANDTRPAEFLYDNLAIETNIIHAAWKIGVEKLMFLGSACIYPREAEQPMTEQALLTGPLEPTNQWYAIAKIAGLKMCEAYRKQYGCDFISAQPINLYGPYDNFDLQSSHVIPALINKAHAAKIQGLTAMEVWGSGTPKREFMHVDDVADSLVYLLKHYSGPLQLNMGTGEEVTIRELAEAVTHAVGFEGELVFDASKLDGAPRKLLDVTLMSELGWSASTMLSQGLAQTYTWYLKNIAD